MDCAVIYSEAALADLEQITAFIARDNPDVAQRFANRLVDLAESLRPLPQRSRPLKKVARCPRDSLDPVSDFLSLRKISQHSGDITLLAWSARSA
jgi:plasmid stabilization system protein ParE